MAYRFPKPTSLSGSAPVDNAIVRFDGTTGELIQRSSPTIDDNGNITASSSFNGSAKFINVTNSSNTASSDVKFELVGGGSSGGDCWVVMVLSGLGATGWHFGLDNSDSDAFIFGLSNSFASNNFLRVSAAGIIQNLKGQAFKVTTTAVSMNVAVTDYYIGVTSNAAARTISLPQASDGIVAGQTFVVKDQAGTAASANNITIDTVGTETIDGAASVLISTDYGSLTFYYDGSNYFVV